MRCAIGEFKNNLNNQISKDNCQKKSVKANTAKKQNYRPELQDDNFFKMWFCKTKDIQTG